MIENGHSDIITIFIKGLAGCLWVLTICFWAVHAYGNKKTRHTHPLTLHLLLAMAIPCTLFIGCMEYYGTEGLLSPLVPETPLASLSGLILLVLGLCLSLWARMAIGKNWSGFIAIKENHELITHGPYRIIRHPIYAGLLLALLGTVIVLRDIWLYRIFPGLSDIFYKSAIRRKIHGRALRRTISKIRQAD